MHDCAVHHVSIDLNFMLSVFCCRISKVDMFQIGCVSRCTIFIIGIFLDALERITQHFLTLNKLRHRLKADAVNEECRRLRTGECTAVPENDNISD